MSTVQETLEELQEKQHELAIYAALVEYLDGRYLPHAGAAAESTLLAADCTQPAVPQEAVEGVRDLLMENHVGPLEQQIATLMAKKVK